MGKSVWMRLAEAVGIETEANWDAAAKRRNMQRYGTQDRRDQQGPMAYFNTRGTGSAQRQASAAGMRPDMTPGRGINAPAPRDVQGQGNPLFDPPKRGLSRAGNAPGQQQDPWTDMMAGPDDEDEGADY